MNTKQTTAEKLAAARKLAKQAAFIATRTAMAAGTLAVLVSK
jgi:hypothetical protein